MTEKQIQDELNKDLLNFYNAPFKEKLPKNIIELFRMAMFTLPPTTHQIHTPKIKEIFGKSVDDLLVGEVGMILKAIMGTSPNVLYVTMDEYLKSQEVLEKLYIRYNSDVADFSKRQDRKQRSLIELGGGIKKPLSIIRKN